MKLALSALLAANLSQGALFASDELVVGEKAKKVKIDIVLVTF